tara:strand:- start:12889 stop:13044 length:156 start_codon:yes stop_codon:yes gene_type:complete
MGFIQKLAKRSNRVKVKPKENYSKDCDCRFYYNVKIPKLTWKYVLNRKNWK